MCVTPSVSYLAAQPLPLLTRPGLVRPFTIATPLKLCVPPRYHSLLCHPAPGPRLSLPTLVGPVVALAVLTVVLHHRTLLLHVLYLLYLPYLVLSLVLALVSLCLRLLILLHRLLLLVTLLKWLVAPTCLLPAHLWLAPVPS